MLEIHLRTNQEVRDYNTLLKMEKSIQIRDNILPNEQLLNQISIQVEECLLMHVHVPNFNKIIEKLNDI
jgi:hypothetical protein